MTRSQPGVAPQSVKPQSETAVGLAKRFGWLAAVLDEMRQMNARMHQRHGASPGLRDERRLDD